MNKIIMAVLMLLVTLTAGCINYGSGSSYGYVTTVEQGLFADRIWFRADTTSSQTDCYSLDKNSQSLYDQLNEAAFAKQRVMMTYKRELMRWTGCSQDTVISVTPTAEEAKKVG